MAQLGDLSISSEITLDLRKRAAGKCNVHGSICPHASAFTRTQTDNGPIRIHAGKTQTVNTKTKDSRLCSVKWTIWPIYLAEA